MLAAGAGPCTGGGAAVGAGRKAGAAAGSTEASRPENAFHTARTRFSMATSSASATSARVSSFRCRRPGSASTKNSRGAGAGRTMDDLGVYATGLSSRLAPLLRVPLEPGELAA